MSQNESKNEPLMKLSGDIKNLVNDGVYSIYPVAGIKGADYVLVVEGRKTFLLDQSGDMLGEGPALESLDIGHPITFRTPKRSSSARANAI